MKKVILVILFFIVISSFASVEASSFDKKDMQKFVDDLSLNFQEWENPKVKKSETLYDIDDTVIGSIYRVFEEGEQSGYVIYLNDFGVVEVTFRGIDEATDINGKVYYSFPGKFFDKKTRDLIPIIESSESQDTNFGSGTGTIAVVEWDYWGIVEIDMTQITYNFTGRTPYLPGNVLTSSSGYHLQKWIDEVPDYLNYDDDYACVPTATAMMMAYYDNEYRTGFVDYSSNFPLEAHGYNNSQVRALVEVFISEMHSNKPGDQYDGTYSWEFSSGLTTYFDGTLYSYYDAYFSYINDENPNTPYEFNNYKMLIERGNPTVLFASSISGSPYEVNHSVAGIGYFINAYMGNGFIVYDENNHGISLLSDDFVMFFGFIYND